MPQFILIAYDAKDDSALQRRMDAREAHLASITKAKAAGNAIAGLAIIENEKMVGSVVITNFNARADFDAWLAADPYTIGGVWTDVTVLEGKMAPTFAELITQGNL